MFAVKKTITLLLFLLATSISAQSVKITYLANEGVLIESGNQKVLIDALFDDFYKDYLSPSLELRSDMISGQSPFEKVDLVLATHIHRDHYEAQISGDFLSDHDESKMISSAQVKADLKEKYVNFSGIEGQIVAHERDLFTIREEVNGILIHAFFINHAGGEQTSNIENMGFIVELGGKKILHLGDADMKIERFEAVNLAQYNVDAALIPYWYLIDENGQKIINEQIKPKNIIGIHFPKAGSPMALEEIAKAYPKAKVFQKSMETTRYE